MTTQQAALITGLSEQRLSPYMRQADGDLADALGHYAWNLQLSESLYPVLQLTEVVFRNALHQALSVEFDTPTWFHGLWLHPREQKAVDKALVELRKRKADTTADRTVAELHFGFWCSLCDKRYEHQQTLWPKLFRHAPLSQIPRRHRHRPGLSRAANRLRQLRNRVFHHEPIWHWRDLPQRHQDALALLSWLNPSVATLATSLDRFAAVHQRGWTPMQELSS